MKRHRHTPEQAVRKLREGERLLNEGKDLAEVLRHLEVSETTWNRWRSQYGGMKATEAKRLRELEVENARLKKLQRGGLARTTGPEPPVGSPGPSGGWTSPAHSRHTAQPRHACLPEPCC